MSWREFLRPWLPPAALRLAKRVTAAIGPAPWEFAPHGFSSSAGGWNVESVARTQEEKWPDFVASLEGKGPIGVNHEVRRGAAFNDLWGHNAAMVFGYVVALAARRKDTLRVLDWGGGIGHYYLIGEVLLPDTAIEYFSQDVPQLAQLGRKLLPPVTFFDQPREFLARRYDLVMAVSSLWYEPDWKTLTRQLLSVCDDYFYLSRMILIDDGDTFVAVQRPWAAGYDTQYACWIFNRQELVSYVESLGAKLVREFLLGDAPHIHRAPSQGSMRGFLFRKEPRS